MTPNWKSRPAVWVALLLGAFPGEKAWAGSERDELRTILYRELVEGQFHEALAGYEELSSRARDAEIRATALYRMGVCQEVLGAAAEAFETYEKVLGEFGDASIVSPAARDARDRLAAARGERMPAFKGQIERASNGVHYDILLDDADARVALYALASDASLNLVLSPQAMGRVTVRLRGVTPREALDGIARSAGLRVEPRGRVHVVLRPEELDAAWEIRGLRLRESFRSQPEEEQQALLDSISTWNAHSATPECVSLDPSIGALFCGMTAPRYRELPAILGGIAGTPAPVENVAAAQAFPSGVSQSLPKLLVETARRAGRSILLCPSIVGTASVTLPAATYDDVLDALGLAHGFTRFHLGGLDVVGSGWQRISAIETDEIAHQTVEALARVLDHAPGGLSLVARDGPAGTLFILARPGGESQVLRALREVGVQARPIEMPGLAVGVGARMPVDFEAADAGLVLEVLAMQAGINLVRAGAPDGRIFLHARDIDTGTLIEGLAAAIGAAVSLRNGTLTLGQPGTEPQTTRVLELLSRPVQTVGHGLVEDPLVDALEILTARDFAGRVHVSHVWKGNRLVLSGPETVVDALARLVSLVDRPVKDGVEPAEPDQVEPEEEEPIALVEVKPDGRVHAYFKNVSLGTAVGLLAEQARLDVEVRDGKEARITLMVQGVSVSVALETMASACGLFVQSGENGRLVVRRPYRVDEDPAEKEKR